MKRESKGQQVKTFQAWVPQPDLSKVKAIIKVHFRADAGTFYIYGPDHILPVVEGQQNKGQPYRINKTSIEASTLAGVLEGYEWAELRYFEILKSEKKQKVIVVNFQCNRSYSDGPHCTKANGPLDTHVRDDIHFVKSPALHLSYEILWKAGEQYYRQHEADDPLHHAHPEGTIIEWTAEREAFFEKMRSGLVHLIDRMIDFERDLASNADLAITAMQNGQALLPPPTLTASQGN